MPATPLLICFLVYENGTLFTVHENDLSAVYGPISIVVAAPFIRFLGVCINGYTVIILGML